MKTLFFLFFKPRLKVIKIDFGVFFRRSDGGGAVESLLVGGWVG